MYDVITFPHQRKIQGKHSERVHGLYFRMVNITNQMILFFIIIGVLVAN